MPQIQRVIISGGGTGGHIFPAVSIANAIRARYPEADIQFVGAEGRMEMERVPKAGYPITGLPVIGFDRKRLWRNFKVLARLYKSMRLARRIVRKVQPQIVIGVGGYASGPTLKAAQRQGIPTLLQEQNSYPGVTNKLLGKKAACVCTAYTEAERFFPAGRVVLTGNPVRESLLNNPLTRQQAKEALGFDASKPLILVVGGSLGARTINEAIAAGLNRFGGADVQLLWQTGKSYASRIPEVMADAPAGTRATAFIDDMATAYAAADLVVSRAGAGTISELELLAKPVILVPSPNVAEDHQRKNALALVNAGGACMVEDADAADTLVNTALKTVSDPDALKRLSEGIATLACHNAADRIVDHIEQIIGREHTN